MIIPGAGDAPGQAVRLHCLQQPPDLFRGGEPKLQIGIRNEADAVYIIFPVDVAQNVLRAAEISGHQPGGFRVRGVMIVPGDGAPAAQGVADGEGGKDRLVRPRQICAVDFRQAGDVRRVGGGVGLPAIHPGVLPAEGDLLHLLRLRHIPGDVQRIQPGDPHAQSQHTQNHGAARQIAQPEYLHGAAQEHLGGEIAHQNAHHQEQRGERSGAKKQIQKSTEQHPHAQRVDDPENRRHRPEGQEIPGAFQLPPAVQNQRRPQQHQANAGQHHHIQPAAGDEGPVPGGVAQEAEGPEGAGHQVQHRAEQEEGLPGDPDPVKLRQVKNGREEIEDQRQEIENPVNQGHGQPIAAAHDAEKGQGEKEQVLHLHPQQPDQPGPGVLPQSRHTQHRQQQVGHQAEQHSGGGVGGEPALPAHGHGVEGVAQPGVEQIAEQEQGAHQGVQAVDGSAVDQVVAQAVNAARVLIQRRQQHQGHADGVQAPGRGEAGDVLFQHGAVKERCSEPHSSHLPAHK